jgi:hypothetical protein
MNHKDDCDRSESYLSGYGYNRVRVCACGAEDHAPQTGFSIIVQQLPEREIEPLPKGNLYTDEA